MNQNRAVIEQDLILIYAHKQPLFFARVEKIEPDVKKGWWRVTMLVLQIPIRLVTWILDEEQVRGADFTMGGIPIQIEIVVPPTEPEESNISEVQHQNVKTPPKAPQKESSASKSTKTDSGARILSIKPKKDESNSAL